MAVLVDVHGSCVSRGAFNKIDNAIIKVNHNLMRNNIASCMMPPCELTFEKGELVKYKSEYAERCMTYALNKKTTDVLLNSESTWLVIDLFDFCQPVAGYKNTTFSTYDYTFMNTSTYRDNIEDFEQVDFLTLPHCLWYDYVYRYFEMMTQRFGDNIILCRLNCSGVFMTDDNRIANIPSNLLHFGNPKYNQQLVLLEEYIICNFPNVHVVDISKYFIPDYSYNSDVTPVHYEEKYDQLLSVIYKDILLDQDQRRYYDTLPVSMTAELLSRPVSDADFMKVYSDRALPFCTDTLLDHIFRQQTIEDIVVNREWIASLYREYAIISEATNDVEHTKLLQKLLDCDGLWNEQNGFASVVLRYIEEVLGYLQIPIADLYEKFLHDLDIGLLEKWTLQLNVMSIVAPEYNDVLYYLSEYYRAIEDSTALLKTTLRAVRQQ